MMTINRRCFFLMPFLALIVAGCSGGNSPTAPEVSQDASIPIELTSWNTLNDAQSSHHYPLLYGQLFIDPTNSDDISIEVVPAHNADMHLNIIRFLEKMPCTNCFQLSNAHLSPDGVLSLDVTIVHPLADTTLTCFDVRCIIMFPYSKIFPCHLYQYKLEPLCATCPGSDKGYLVNYDGYTSLYNPTTAGQGPNGLQGCEPGKYSLMDGFTIPAHANAYKRHITEIPENIRNAFYAYTSSKVTYEIKLPSSDPLLLTYCVDASWELPNVIPVEDPMTDFGLDANSPEAWKIDAHADPISSSGEALLTFDVYDWQGMSTISSLAVESPDLFYGLIEPDFVVEGDGYSRWEAIIPNEKGSPPGEYPCLISVEDTENNPNYHSWLDLRAYQILQIIISGDD